MSYPVMVGIKLGAGLAGVTMYAQLLNLDGTDNGTSVSTGFLEVGGGEYVWSGVAPDGFTGVVKFNRTSDDVLMASATLSPTFSTAEMNQVADAILNRDMAAAPDTNQRSLLQSLRFLRNRFTTITGQLIVYKEDDATQAWTSAVQSDAAAAPITGMDPT